MEYNSKDIKRICEAPSIAIYGARIVATEVANCLMKPPYEKNILCFLVSSHDGNPDELCGRKVLDLSEAVYSVSRDTLILIAVLEKYVDEIVLSLKHAGYNNVIPLTFESDVWAEVRGNVLWRKFRQNGDTYIPLERYLNNIDIPENGNKKVNVYSVTSIYDHILRESSRKYCHEIPIQVGAALTDQHYTRILDNQGDNISERNQQYCELTGLYWIWKHDDSDYVGLCHYRRHFVLSESEYLKLTNSDLDIVLTIPIMNFPNVRSVYEHDHDADDIKTLMEVIAKYAPEYLEASEKLFNGNYYFAYNMFIMKRNVMDDYCQWLFPILEYCRRKTGIKADPYQNRYIGFLGERLLSIYTFQHKKELSVAIAKKHFIM